MDRILEDGDDRPRDICVDVLVGSVASFTRRTAHDVASACVKITSMLYANQILRVRNRRNLYIYTRLTTHPTLTHGRGCESPPLLFNISTTFVHWHGILEYFFVDPQG